MFLLTGFGFFESSVFSNVFLGDLPGGPNIYLAF